MAQSKKPRKAYRPRDKSELVSVSRVSMSIDRARINKHRVSTIHEMKQMEDWQHCPSLLQGVAEAIAMAIKTIEGWEDPDCIGDVMVDAMGVIKDLSDQGHIWRVGKPADMLVDAFDAACQILMGQHPREKLSALEWAQSVAEKVRNEVAAC